MKKVRLSTITILSTGIAIVTFLSFGDLSSFRVPSTDENNEQIEPGKKGLKHDEPGMFLRMHEYWQTREGMEKPEYKSGYKLFEYEKANANAISKVNGRKFDTNATVSWVERGPGNVGGRTPGIWVDLSDATHSTWLAGSSGGGIWKTSDAGETWAFLTPDLPNQNISDIRGSKSDHDIVYAATGKKFSNGTSPGNGILKSLDKGNTWSVISSTLGDPRFVNVSRIAVDQTNPNNIMASTFADFQIRNGADSYVLKSTDGGTTWSEVLNSSNFFQQVVVADDDFSLQFVSENGTSIRRSIDSGENWEVVFDSDDFATSGASLDRMEVTISPSNSNNVFVAVYASNSSSTLFFSRDKGDNWFKVEGKDTQNDFGNWLGGQGWYDNAIGAHPYIDTCVFVAGVSSILKITLEEETSSTAYTGTLEVLTDGYGEYQAQGSDGSKGVHVDHHLVLLHPTNEANKEYYILNGNDGGVAVSKDEGVTFKQTGDTFKNSDGEVYETFTGYNTVEFYGVDKKNGDDRYVAGAQDNGSWVSGVDPQSTSTWAAAPSGDGFEAAWHYTDGNLILESSQFNNIFKSTDEGASWNNVPIPGSGPFLTGIENSKQDPDLVFVGTNGGVARSFNFGDTWETLDMPDSWSFSGFNTPIDISLINPEVVWSGTGMSESNRIAVSKDGGTTWAQTALYADATFGGLVDLATHPSEEATAYALFGAANGPKILKTTDFGESWADISGFVTNEETSSNGFPDVPVFSLVVMPFDHNIIWAGSSIGIVESLDGGSTWALKTDHNLPAVTVYDMSIVNDEVIIATHGLGIWSATLPELDGYEPTEVALAPFLAASSTFFGAKISGSITLRSEYTSSTLTVSSSLFTDQVILEKEANVKGEVLSWSFDLSTVAEIISDQDVTITLTSVKDGKEFTRVISSNVIALNDPVESHQEDLETNASANLLLDGFVVSDELSVEGNALHSPHPYGASNQYSFTLKTPLMLKADTAILTYQDVALVEPGDDFGSRFYDFVAIEALKLNTSEWIRLTRYDAREHSDWLSAYNASADPTQGLFKKQRIDLFEDGHFVEGDSVLVRFVLESDPEAEGYGWIVDNIEFNYVEEDVTPPLSVKPVEDLINIYPNPIRSVANLNYEVRAEDNVQITLHSLNGAVIDVLQSGKQPVGKYAISYDASSLLPGIYLCKVQMGAAKSTLKWIVENR